jgi:hypothetical protein
MPADALPTDCPFTLEQITDTAWYPDWAAD